MSQGLLWAKKIFWPVENKSINTRHYHGHYIFSYELHCEHKQKFVGQSKASRVASKFIIWEQKINLYVILISLKYRFLQIIKSNHSIAFAFWCFFFCCLHKSESEIRTSLALKQIKWLPLTASASCCAACWCVGLTWWLNIWWEMMIRNRQLWILRAQIQSHLLH